MKTREVFFYAVERMDSETLESCIKERSRQVAWSSVTCEGHITIKKILLAKTSKFLMSIILLTLWIPHQEFTPDKYRAHGMYWKGA